jgi:hypothetical protein
VFFITVGKYFPLKYCLFVSSNFTQNIILFLGAILDKRPNVSVTDLSLYAGQWLKNAPYRKQDDGSFGRRDKKFKEIDEQF